ncbi:ABC transporter permease subunit [Chelatococcus sp. SYSU_G07232]|uniref:ABC transporter permease subunit n=1 Tax=Chelatococcus albus TaxID=3047466 RepID=A0ABT7AI99_9HYPH|nr:ABC transporter permease subunit [Chelatococcus sp. SYSU_G07232]MDJ1159093.1 ABC transporter permease subunit [Chelatococcus sp. SYSU_G07232]
MPFRLAPVLTLAVLLLPVAAGLAGVLLPAFGHWPVLGRSGGSLDAWRELAATPGLTRSTLISLWVGLATTALSLAVVIVVTAVFQGTRAFAVLRRLIAPLLAAPHVALAIGLAFVLAPSGLVLRLLSPWATGYTRPPDLLTVNDPWGFSLIAGLALKETAFLFLMTLAALPQADAARTLTVARTLGYGRVTGWIRTVWPRVYPQIRLPVVAVLAYGTSVVDVALVLGPTSPPPLAVAVLRWASDPDLATRFKASAGAVLQVLVVAVAIALWLGGEAVVRDRARTAGARGARTTWEGAGRLLAWGAAGVIALTLGLALASLVLWSFAESWRFPQLLPAALTSARWIEGTMSAAAVLGVSASIAAIATGLALALVLGCLENEVRTGRTPGRRVTGLLYLPLIVPQVAFLTGLEVVFLPLGLDGGWAAVVLAHLVFVLPYVFLSLADPWRAYDERYRTTALCLGASPLAALVKVRLPMLMRPVLTAAAIGFSVSIDLYLPTLVVGAGRFPTITTEAVALASGGDRRIIGVHALLQALLPFLAFAAAIGVPLLVFRHRRGLRDA